VVPITWVEHRKFSLRISLQPGERGLERRSWAKCDQVTALDKKPVRYLLLGRVSDATLSRIEAAIKTALALG